MSIEMDNPKTLLEKIDAAANLVEQMHLSHMTRDEKHFQECHTRAASLLADAITMAEELES